MRKNIAKVIEAFKAGKAAKGDSKNTCHTDGHTIFSYRMVIAWREDDGTIRVVPYNVGPSRTTKSHIRACQIELERGQSYGIGYMQGRGAA